MPRSTGRKIWRSGIVLWWLSVGFSAALLPSSSRCSESGRMAPTTEIKFSNHNNSNDNDIPNFDDDDEQFIYDRANRIVGSEKETPSSSSTSSSTNMKANYMDDLTPPPINFARDSILFSENPTTKSNSGGLKIWQFCKQNLPPVFTGAWPWRDTQVADDNPIGGLYNMLFVRLPVIIVTAVYTKNTFESHPLVMDIGQGPVEMSPLVVYAVLALILA